ncbi:ABC transporter permease [Hydrogenibacillus schlegelii]|uniref:Spermidine/putrescine ABC transporter permease n=1 Tax=Hydrogenibacillus schlegelii TaxID=1484 RepID=A0A132N7I0_HYDSH|nr:ABC transporter permease [Hydrogenibacillus schlegelii]KWX06063.1 spermidine/purescine ABC transporter permease [Hydrogenibacillus schlegelii]OAR04335.1 spermidine/putrescine ABC transporter permease [Hydrogenibacillus schlegelii]
MYLIAVFLVLYAPIGYLFLFSFNEGGQMVRFTGWTLEWYRAIADDKRLIAIALTTVLIALLSSAAATAVGTLGAIGLYELRRRTRDVLLVLNNVHLVSSDVVIGASFLLLFTALGLRLGFTSVLLSHIAFSIPIVVLMVLPKLYEMPPTLLDAARDLGAGPLDVLRRVILPYISPGVLAGFFMALTYSLDDFAVTFFVTGSGFSTLSVEIYSRARRGISLEINALSVLLFIVTLLFAAGYAVISRHGAKIRGVFVRR